MTLDAMLGELEEEASALNTATVERRIESYRPSNTKLTVAACANLRMNLTAAFTTTQLSNYISKHRVRGSEREILAGMWWPETSRHRHDSKGKASLADLVLRDCWQVNIGDETGQLDLQLRSSLLNLLLYADHFSFDRIAGLHQANIDVTQSLGLVRITARRDVCESIREKILDAVSRVQQMDVGLGSGVLGLDLGTITSPRFLKWLGETYGVFVELGLSKLPERIHYLAENKTGADDARRTLHLAVSHAASAPIPFSTYFPASEPAEMHRHNPAANLSWVERQKQWFRWSIPTVRTVGGMMDPTPVFDGHQTQLSDELLKLLRSPPEAAVGMGTEAGWGESVTAFVGQCLFAPKPPLESTTLSASQLGKSSCHRAFATDIPRAISFLHSVPRMDPTVRSSPIHRLRLLPAIQGLPGLPELDVRFALQPPANSWDPSLVEIHDVKLVFNANHVHYLLPENGLDLRFTRKLYRAVQSDDSPTSQKLKEDIGGCLQKVFGTGDANNQGIAESAFTTIPLPLDLLPVTHAAALDKAASGNRITAEYLIPPLNDVRGTNVQLYSFQRRELLCSFSSLGPFLPAQVTELSLHSELVKSESAQEPNSSSVAVDQDFHSFYNSACDLAFQAHLGHLAKPMPATRL